MPIGLGLGFVILLTILFRDRLLPARTVDIVRVVTLPEDPGSAPVTANVEQGSYSAFEAPVVFQASGWIEPDPLPVKATTLISGVVDKVFVLEGESVREGDIIATLVEDDAEQDLATAEASLRVMESRLVSNEADQDATRASIDVHTKRLKAAEALLVFRLEEADRFASAGPDGIPKTTIIESRQKAVAQRSEIEAIEFEVAEAMAQLRRILSLREELQAEIALAQTEVERRKLALDRTRIRAPISGRVMRLFAKPGQQRMLGPENHDSAAIAYLYDP
ncbi:MAG: biotin/lipoyl-binding protein, partial [Opitutales bacterium]|nr:biotin/lipoyl-binding protein [Opitutales bacterium]